MSQKIKVLFLSLLVLLGVTATLSAKPKQTIIGKTYLIKQVNGQNVDYGEILQMFISFEEDELLITLVGNGQEESTSEEISYDEKTKILTEYTEDGQETTSTIEFDGTTVTMTNEDGTVMVMEEVE
ncbi:MAG: hypothetical protein J6X54_00980 [Treponema sp.]|nr:hypothetical protein [Treponema sp.]